MKNRNTKKIVVFLAAVLIVVVTIAIFAGTHYSNNRLLISNESTAVDFARLIRNNYTITDKEVTYMKSLSFDEMENDPINLRLMNIVSDSKLEAGIVNVYVVARLEDSEVKYIIDESNASDFECDPGTPLCGIWLLNGKFDEKGTFLQASRDDIYRYTDITDEIAAGLNSKQEFGTYTADEWGEFITGYVPLYTVEGNYVGMLGVDINPDKFQASTREFIPVFSLMLGLTVLIMTALFLIFYFRYNKARESKIYFDFYSKMSHDMRTPMNGIIGMVDLAENENDVTVLHDYFDKVGEASRYLLSLINDTLDEGKISSGKMIINETNVRFMDMIEEIADIVKISAERKKISFTIETNVSENQYVLADRLRFKQVMTNLLSNAVKFTDEGGNVRLHINSSDIGTEYYEYIINIIDDGIGMSEEYIKKSLYKPFSQETNTIRNMNSGSGLGLVITKNLLHLMDGTISVKSELGKGTDFTVNIRLKKGNVEQNFDAKEKETVTVDITGTKILLCEDHPLNSEIARKLLEKKGCEVCIAENGKICVEMFQKSNINYYDIILMDIRMPVMNGLEATKCIRKLDREDAVNIPIVAMTANAYEEDVKNSIKSGMNEHLSKPINANELYSTIERLTK